MRRLALLALLSACTTRHVGVSAAIERCIAPGTPIAIEVVNASGRELPAPRPGVTEEIARLATGRERSTYSTEDAFSAAATTALGQRGVAVLALAAPNGSVLRVSIRDLDVRNQDAAGAVAFVSATYVLVMGPGTALWQMAQLRLPIRLASPDLTRAELNRIATEAVRRGLSSFPMCRS